MHRLLVLQHSDRTGPGHLLLYLTDQLGISLHTVRIWEEAATDFLDYDALIILGGPQNIDQEDLHPYLKEEKRVIRAWLSENKPCLGFSLGHQLLAEAAGATIGPNPKQSKGFIIGHLTQDGKLHPLFHNINTPIELLKWHSQEIQLPLPRNMHLLATSQDCMVEAFCLDGRPHVIGLQCDNYLAHPEDIRALLGDPSNPITSNTANSPSARRILQQAQSLLDKNSETIGSILKNFLTMTGNKT